MEKVKIKIPCKHSRWTGDTCQFCSTPYSLDKNGKDTTTLPYNYIYGITTKYKDSSTLYICKNCINELYAVAKLNEL